MITDTFEEDIEKIRSKAEVALDLEPAVLYLQRKHSIKKKFADIGALLDYLKYDDHGYELLDEICKDQSKSKIMQSIRPANAKTGNPRNNDHDSSWKPTKSRRLEELLNSNERWNILCAKLDSAYYWKRLGDPLNIPVHQMSRLEETFSKDPMFSPSNAMLQKWITQEDPTVDLFVDILETIRHATAKKLILDWLQQ